mmetsp:Transcript_7999/g.21367  ORF Transcript_7999/g.21367 Transcript_7999/m.21367 type:complete len:222 (-) Transcript_7999:772-1437(-)
MPCEPHATGSASTRSSTTSWFARLVRLRLRAASFRDFFAIDVPRALTFWSRAPTSCLMPSIRRSPDCAAATMNFSLRRVPAWTAASSFSSRRGLAATAPETKSSCAVVRCAAASSSLSRCALARTAASIVASCCSLPRFRSNSFSCVSTLAKPTLTSSRNSRSSLVNSSTGTWASMATDVIATGSSARLRAAASAVSPVVAQCRAMSASIDLSSRYVRSAR